MSDILNLTTKAQSDSFKTCWWNFYQKKSSISVSIINQAYPVKNVSIAEITEHQRYYLEKILKGVKRKTADVDSENIKDETKKETNVKLNYNTNLVIIDLIKFPFDF